MFAFAVKAPLWPFHRWLPDACVEATPATAVLITAVMDKVGTFGMLRYCLQLFPDASTYFRPMIVTLAIIGAIYGAVVAIGQTDILRARCLVSGCGSGWSADYRGVQKVAPILAGTFLVSCMATLSLPGLAPFI